MDETDRYAGVMVTDRGRSYDAQAFDRVDQQKCLAHILRSISDVVARKTGRARDFGVQLKAVLQDARSCTFSVRIIETDLSRGTGVACASR